MQVNYLLLSAQGLGIDGAVIHLNSAVKILITSKDGTSVFLINEDVRSVTITYPSYFTKEIILSGKMHYVLQMVSKAAKQICPPVMMGKILVHKTN